MDTLSDAQERLSLNRIDHDDKNNDVISGNYQNFPMNYPDEDNTIRQERKVDTEIVIEVRTRRKLLYNVADHPPLTLTLISGLQHTLLSLSSSLAVSILVADVVCAEQNEELKSRILSSNFLMNGLTTIIMNLFGIRLPLYQGSADDYLVPLIAMQVINQDRCSIQNHLGTNGNTTSNSSAVSESSALQYEHSLSILRELQGSLIAAGLCHFLIGFSGMVAVLLKFIGPITIVPTIFLAITFFTRTTTKFAMAYWGVSLPVAAMAVILSIYLANHSCPIPFWSRKKGFHLTRYPVHQVFSLLIAMLIGWTICGIMTAAGVFSDDPSSREYLARTDAKTAFVEKAPWFNVPYPGQFGPYKFSISVFVGFIIATITSILDSIGDYYACAKMCEVPPPPPHAVNRGIAIEGLMSTLSGFVGCGHATSTYGGNIGAIGITRVASRDVFLATGIIYVIFGMIGKVSAVFLTIPYPVLGGALIVMFGMFTGVVLSNLQVVSLSSSRNLAIIGLSILFGLMIPYWIEKYPDQISLGSEMGTNVLKMLLATPSISGGMLACFLDNTVPGSFDERGISAWRKQIGDSAEDRQEYSMGYEVYQPLFYDFIMKIPVLNRLPILPKRGIQS